MSDAPKISFAEWWKFERETISTAWKATDKKASAIWSLVSGMFMAFLQLNEGFKTQHETLVSILNIFIVATVVFLAQFLLKLIRTPALLSKIDREDLGEKKAEFHNEKRRLEIIIESLRTPSEPQLEIEIINPVERNVFTSRNTYRIKVKNTHSKKVVKRLRVWLCEINWPQTMEIPLEIRAIKWPYQLPEKENQNNSLAHDLAAGLEMEFDLMFVDVSHYKRVINLAPFQPKLLPSNSHYRSVTAKISFNIDMLPRDNSKLIFKFKVTGGDGDIDTITESYTVNVPPLLPGNDTFNQVTNINSLMKEPDKYMPIFEKINKSTEKTAAELSKRKEAVAKLTEFGTIFLQRITSIKGVDPNTYNPEKDDELWNANAAAIAYIVLNLNQDAAKVYDDGVAEINSYSVRQPGIGSTRYEDDHRVVLTKFNRRFQNLKRIIDEIDKYIRIS